METKKERKEYTTEEKIAYWEYKLAGLKYRQDFIEERIRYLKAEKNTRKEIKKLLDKNPNKKGKGA